MSDSSTYEADLKGTDGSGLEQNGHSAVVLVGNPNVGKSVLFKRLTNRYVIVSNYPGTTVEIVRAKANFNGRRTEVIDTPGLNDLAPRSDDARVTLGLLDENPDATIVQVMDAKNLRRGLLLTLQLAALHRPMVLVLNMADELLERGGQIDTDRLGAILGIPVVATVAIKNEGVADLIATLPEARIPTVSMPRDGFSANEPAQSVAGAYESNRERLAAVRDILTETYSITVPDKPSFRVRLGLWAMHPVKGLAAMAVVLFVVFWFVGLFGAGTLVDLLEVGVFEQRLSPLAVRGVDAVLPFPHEHVVELSSHQVGLPVTPVHEIGLTTMEKTVIRPDYTVAEGVALTGLQQIARFFHDFFVGEFGFFTMAISYAFAIVLPIVTTFFIVFSILEDSGYFPRMAIMLNKTFKSMGLNGKAVIPMILGLGCATMATMTTRILETRKERVVTIMLLALAVPCSAQLGVLLAMMASLSPLAAFLWLLIVIAVLLAVGWLTARAYGGETSEFILEIPPMRRPELGNVLIKTASRIEWYLREVIPIFVVGTAVLFVLDRLHFLDWASRAARPLVTGFLGLPGEMSNAFLVGFMRRDFGAVYILDAAMSSPALLTPHQIFVAMVVITLFMPCFATLLMISKEQGPKVAALITAFIFPFAFLVGGLVNLLGRWLPL